MRKEGLAKVRRKRYAKKLCAASSDIDHAREICIELQRVQQPRQHDHHALIISMIGKQLPHQRIETISDNQLLEQPPTRKLRPICSAASARNLP